MAFIVLSLLFSLPTQCKNCLPFLRLNSLLPKTFLRFFAKNGLKVGYFKPCETGVIDFPLDGTKMLNLTKEGIVVQFLP